MLAKSKSVSARRFAVFAVMAIALISSMLIPRGYMIAPSSTHLFSVSACPETNPIARLAVRDMGDEQRDERRMAHAAMGHDTDPAHGDPGKGQTAGDCSFAGFTAQGLAPDHEPEEERLSRDAAPVPPAYRGRAEQRPLRLRPPLRAPPFSA